MKPRNETITMNTLLATSTTKYERFIEAVTLLRNDDTESERPKGVFPLVSR